MPVEFKSENENFQQWKQSKFVEEIKSEKYATPIEQKTLFDLKNTDELKKLIGDDLNEKFEKHWLVLGSNILLIF